MVWWLNLRLGKRKKTQPRNLCRSPPQKTNAGVMPARKEQIEAEEGIVAAAASCRWGNAQYF